jgi:protein CMS1
LLIYIYYTTMAQTPAKVAKTGGDDLDDGLELDPGLLASSDNEDEGSDLGSDVDIGDEETRAAVDEDDDEEDEGVDVGEKRKRDVGDDDEDAAAAEKRRRKREKFKERKAKVCQNYDPPCICVTRSKD